MVALNENLARRRESGIKKASQSGPQSVKFFARREDLSTLPFLS